MVQSGLKAMGRHNADIDADEVFNKAEQQEKQSSANSDDLSEQPSPPRPRRIEEEFENVTPEEAPQQQFIHAQRVARQPATSSTTTVAQPPTGPASRQIQRIKVGQQLLPVDDHNDYNDHDHDHNKADERQPQRQTTDQQLLTKEQNNEQSMHYGTVANRNLGKRQLTDDPLGDPWTPDNATVKEQVEILLKTKEAKVMQLEQEMRKMQRTIEEFQNRFEPQRTPVVTNIATPQTPDVQRTPNIGNVIVDFNIIKHIQKGDKTTISALGVIRRPIQSPSADTSSDRDGGNDNGQGIYNVANGGGDQGWWKRGPGWKRIRSWDYGEELWLCYKT